MSRARSETRREAATSEGGATGLIRSLGSAVGFVRRLVPVGTGAAPKPRRRAAPPPAAPKTPVVTKPARGRPSVPAEADRKQSALEREIATLEAELERTYAAIAECTVGQSVDPRTATPALNELIARQRDLKDRLFAARHELARLERLIARERRLQAVPDVEEVAGVTEPARVTAPRSRPATRSVGLGAIAAAVRKKVGTTPVADAAEVDRLAQELRHPDPDVRREAIARLGEAGGRAAVDLLVAALDEDVERVKVAALHALARTGGGRALDAFRRLAQDDSAQLRLAALRGLATVEGEAAREPLIRALADDDATVRRAVAAMLGWQHVTEAWGDLRFCLSDPDEGVRAAAATALGDLRDDRAVLALIRAVADRSPLVAEAARTALRVIVGDPIDGIGEGLGATARVEMIRQWWTESRVAFRLARQGLGEDPGVGTAAAPEPAPAPAGDVVASLESTAFESLIGEEATGTEATAAEGWTEEGAGAFENLVGEEEAAGGAFESLIGDDEGPSDLPEGVLPVIEDDGKKGRSSG